MKGLELVSKKKKERKKLFRQETTVGPPRLYKLFVGFGIVRRDESGFERRRDEERSKMREETKVTDKQSTLRANPVTAAAS